jgi:hypothetical protein
MDIIDNNNNPDGFIEPDTILENAKGKYEKLFICGYNADGDLVIFSSHNDAADLNWLLDETKNELHYLVRMAQAGHLPEPEGEE